MTGKPVGGELSLDHLFVTYRETDSGDRLFYKTAHSAMAMLWVLGRAEATLAALYDLIASASGEEGLRAALAARLGEHPDALA